MNRVGVLHLIDTLTPGGAEHIAVLFVNNLSREKYRAYLCASRTSGSLQSRIKSDVIFFDLHRRCRFDVIAFWKLFLFIRRENIQIIHAHTTSLYLGYIISLLNPRIKLIWHDHVGKYELPNRSNFLFRLFTKRAKVVFTVTRDLENWAVRVLGLPKTRVFYLPNFLVTEHPSGDPLNLPGEPGKRLVCVANIRIQKDHITLLRAFAQVLGREQKAHLILVGADADLEISKQVQIEIEHLDLTASLTMLGPRDDISSILAGCDIGVLSSKSEGFPVVLLEYGSAGLAVAATQVGECSEILDYGCAGLLVPPENPDALALSLIQLLDSPQLRAQLASRLFERVSKEYSSQTILNRVSDIYDQIL
jgi:glycosyltransferase involved in cell wall biosynthesis